MRYARALALAGAFALTLVPRVALAHCDTLDGPVVKDARVALDAKDVTPVLKWVAHDKEGEIRDAFQHALGVRALGPEARALADRFFFETLVRVHRAGEGAPYTGLKPAGSAVDPGIAASDAALETGSVDALVTLFTTEVDKGLRHRFAQAAAARRSAAVSVEKGREFVAAYVDLMHYAERLLQDTASAGHVEPAAHAQPVAPSGHAQPPEHSH